MKNHSFNEESVLESLKKGDDAAISKIYEHYWQRLLAIAYNHTGENDTASEIVQEILIDLWNRREVLEIDSLTNYLGAAVKYAVYNHYNKQKRRESILSRIFPFKQSDPGHEKIYARMMEDYINGAVEKLPEKCRLVFKFSRQQGKSNSEISKELNIAEKTVEAHLTKALASLRYSLKNVGMFTVCLLALFGR